MISDQENVFHPVICKLHPFYLDFNMLNFSSSALMVVTEEVTDPSDGYASWPSSCGQ